MEEDDNDIDETQQQQQQTSRKLQRISSSSDKDKTEMRDWSNPSSRIIRVSRASGGKDRHSKVLTSKGLRDRRIRLSVSTAIQFYDLQDRLGFDQPSKAVEWLINAASGSISGLDPIETNFEETLSLSKSSTSESSLSRTEKAREKEKDSFTQLLTGGLDEPNRNWTGGDGGGGSNSDCFNPVQLIPNYNFVPNYNFGMSSSDSPGAARGTLQSNSQSLFLNNNNIDHHNHQLQEAFDGRLYLYYGQGNRSSDDKGKDRR